MRILKRLVRSILRLVAIGLIVVGAVLASSWFEMLIRDTADISASGAPASAPTGQAPHDFAWAVPLLLSGLVLLVLSRKRDRILSLTHHSDDT